MPSSSFFTDGETYDTAVVTSNDTPASTTPSQAPSSFFSNGGVVGEGTVVSNETGPGPTSNTPSSFFTDGAVVASETVENNDAPADTTPSQAPSSFFQNGNVYDFLSQESEIVALLEQLAATTTTNAANASSSATDAANSATNAATSAANAAAAVQSAAGTATPVVDGTASVGSSSKWAHEDHVHPTDVSRASVTYVDTQVAAAVAPKADKTYVDAQDATKANTTYVDAADAARVSKAGDTMTGRLVSSASTVGISDGTGSSGLWVMSSGTTDAYLTFHRPGYYAVNFGLSTDGNLYYGGWSAGAGVAYRLWTTKDFNYTPVSVGGYQNISGGFTITAYNLGNLASFTPNPLLGNYQYGTNVGAFTITAPSVDCAVDVVVYNASGAGTISFSGFRGGTTGEPLTTTVGSAFLISIRRIGGFAMYAVKALQ